MRIALLVFLLMLHSVTVSGQGSVGDYDQDTVISDGPIQYGTGLSDADRATAWKSFFMRMVEEHVRQHGQESLGIKLLRRCEPGKDSCIIMLDADLVGIGGIKEPRLVILLVATDVNDPNKQVARLVCTRPAKDVQFCRDWNTGKLIRDDNVR